MLSKTFNTSKANLNKKQREAVDTIEGPMLVIAGPGTGKTQLLSIRVGNILNQTDVDPSNILCLTFTDAAREEMYDRLNVLIGPSSSNVNIYTYHSLGSELIKSYPEYFENIINSNLVEEVNKINIIRKIQSGLSYKNKYKQEHYLVHLISTISDLKRALISPEELISKAKDNIKFIEEKSKDVLKISNQISRVSVKNAILFNQLLDEDVSDDASLKSMFNLSLVDSIKFFEETKKTKLITEFKNTYLEKNNKNDFVVSSLETNQKLLDLAEIYKKYINTFSEKRLHDFDDIISYTVSALKDNPEFRYTLQEKYQFILLDEYQDTNEAQAQIVKLLSDHPLHEGKPNVMAVGDDDQAIYAFQGAKHFHMLDFVKSYEDVKVVVLNENYRSTQKIIDVSNHVANKIESRLSKELDIDKNFESRNIISAKVERLIFESPKEEQAYLMDNIKNMGEVAILSPKHDYLQKLAYLLSQEGIDVNYEKKENLLEDELVKIVLLNLSVINAIATNNKSKSGELLPILLNQEYLNIDFKDILEISFDKQGDWINRLAEHKSTSNLSITLSKLAVDSLSLTFDHIIDKLIGLEPIENDNNLDNKFHEYYLKDDSKLVSLLSKLVTIRNSYNQFLIPEKLTNNLASFIEYIETLTNNNIVINSVDEVTTKSKIKLMTAFSSKGREFDTVYIPSFTDEFWGSKARGRNSFISLPINLKYIRHTSNTQDDKLRLLYVAMTRAKNNLILTSSISNEFNKKLNGVNYLDEKIEKDKESAESLLFSPLFNEHSIEPLKIKLSRKFIIDDWQSAYKEFINRTDINDILRNRISNFKLSPSALNNFIDVKNAGPKSFLEHYILKYPSPDNLNMIFGNIIHDSLDFIQKKLNEYKSIPTFDEIEKRINYNIENLNLIENDKKYLSEKAEDLFKYYIENYISDFKVGNLSEVPLSQDNIVINGAKLTGKIDKITIDQDSNTLNIYDYKTGKSYDKWSKEAKLHLNMNQLYFYKILLNSSKQFSKYDVGFAALDFVESRDKDHLLKTSFKPEKEEHIRKLIKAVWNHIENLNFPDISKYPTTVAGIEQFEEDLINGAI